MLAALLSACSPASDIYQGGADVAGKDSLVFVHGYYGSALREKGGGPRRFITIPTILAGSFAIALESKALGVRPSPELEVEGLLSRVSVLPFFYNNDVYGSFLESLSANHPVEALAYDWRQDLHQAAAALDEKVKSLKARGARSVSIVAHSMGGLVTAYYLGYGAQRPELARLNWAGAQDVAKVAFFGVPFGGAVAIFRNMQHGTGYPWNKSLLESGTVSSWPASYHLIPLRQARMLEPNGQEITVPLRDPAFWQQQKLGLLREDSPHGESRLAFTGAQLERAGKFLDLIHGAQGAPAKLRVLNVRGRGSPTLARGYFDGQKFVFLPEDAKKRGLPFEALQADGDGSVPFEATAHPPAFTGQAKEIYTNYAHDRLFADPTVAKECLDFLSQEI